MKIGYTVPYRRKREGRTDYNLRLKILAGRKPRVVVRRTLKHLILQVVDYTPTGDKVLVASHTHDLGQYGWKAGTGNIPAGYLAGLLLGVRAKKAGITSCVADIGMHPAVHGGVVFAALKGCVEAGISLPLDDKVVPDQKRLSGEHISHWGKTVTSKPQSAKQHFREVVQKGLVLDQFGNHVAQVRKAILGGQ